MRQTYMAGDKLFVDWAGGRVPIIDPMPDNLKAGITKPSRYEPGVNRTYQDLADHYGFVVLPARVRRPRDKAKVEAAVGIVSRFVLGKLRNRRFFSLIELNDAVRDCVKTINAKVMKHLKRSRNDLFASLDRPALKGLPSERYQYAEWKRCTVAPDYHVEVDDHYYSVPFGLLRETVEARFTDCTIEVLHRGSGLRATCARASCTSTRRSRSTCRRAIGVTRNGRRHACCVRPRRSAPPRSRCSRRS